MFTQNQEKDTSLYIGQIYLSDCTLTIKSHNVFELKDSTAKYSIIPTNSQQYERNKIKLENAITNCIKIS